MLNIALRPVLAFNFFHHFHPESPWIPRDTQRFIFRCSDFHFGPSNLRHSFLWRPWKFYEDNQISISSKDQCHDVIACIEQTSQMNTWYLETETSRCGERERNGERKGDYLGLIILYIRRSLISIFSIAFPRGGTWVDIAGRSNSQMQHDPGFLLRLICQMAILTAIIFGIVKKHKTDCKDIRITNTLHLLYPLRFSSLHTHIYSRRSGKLGQQNWMKKIKLTGNKSDSKKNNLPEVPGPRVEKPTGAASIILISTPATAGYPPIRSTESLEEAFKNPVLFSRALPAHVECQFKNICAHFCLD